MNRRDFLKVITATAAVVAAPSLIPADARLVLDAKKESVIGNITRTIDWHDRHMAYFVNYHGTINRNEYFWGIFVEDKDAKTLLTCDDFAMKAFKRRSDLIFGKKAA